MYYYSSDLKRLLLCDFFSISFPWANLPNECGTSLVFFLLLSVGVDETNTSSAAQHFVSNVTVDSLTIHAFVLHCAFTVVRTKSLY